MSKYNIELDLENENSLSILLSFIEPNSVILEFGSSHGRLTKHLKKNLNCIVDIIELDEEAGKDVSQYARKALIGSELGNIENYKWVKELEGNQYDYIIFADVLEHLYSPEKALAATKPFLNEAGQVLISVPNVGHDGILLELFNEKFNYRPVGLLDDTHIRFFTYSTLTELIQQAGFIPINQKAHYLELTQTEFSAYVKHADDSLIDRFSRRIFGNVYQFIFALELAKQSETDNRIINKLTNVRSGKYFFKLHIKEKGDNNFVKEKAVFSQATGQLVQFNLERYNNIIEIRLDPCEQSAVIKLNNHSNELVLINSNASFQNGNTFIFESQEPQLIFDANALVNHAVFFEIYVIPVSQEAIRFFNKNIIQMDITDKLHLNNTVTQQQSKISHLQEQLVTTQEQLVTTQEQLVTAQELQVTTQEQLVTAQELQVTTQEQLVTAQELQVTTQEQLVTAQELQVTTQEQLVTAQELQVTTQEQLVTAQELQVTTQEQLVTAQELQVTTQEQLVTAQEQLVTTQEQLVTTQEQLVTAQEQLVTTQEQLVTTQEQLVTAQEQLASQTHKLKEIYEYKKSKRYKLLQFLKILK